MDMIKSAMDYYRELVAALDVIKRLAEANAAWAAEFDRVWQATGDPYQKDFKSLERVARELRQENERLRSK